MSITNSADIAAQRQAALKQLTEGLTVKGYDPPVILTKVTLLSPTSPDNYATKLEPGSLRFTAPSRAGESPLPAIYFDSAEGLAPGRWLCYQIIDKRTVEDVIVFDVSYARTSVENFLTFQVGQLGRNLEPSRIKPRPFSRFNEVWKRPRPAFFGLFKWPSRNRHASHPSLGHLKR